MLDQKNVLYQIKLGVCVVSWGASDALILYFGNRSLLRGNFAHFNLRNFFEYLRIPRSLQDIQSEFNETTPADIDSCLGVLNRAHFLIKNQEGDRLKTTVADLIDAQAVSQNFVVFLQRFFQDQASLFSTLQRLKSTRVICLNFGPKNEGLKHALREFSIEQFQEFWSPMAGSHVEKLDEIFFNQIEDAAYETVYVVQATWFDSIALKEINRWFAKRRLKWIPMLSDPFGGSIGPLLGVEDGPCFECYYQRRKSHISSPDTLVEFESYFALQRPRQPGPLKIFEDQLTRATAVEILKFLIQGPLTRLIHGVHEFDYLNQRSEFHSVLASPICAVCGPVFTEPLEITESNEL